MTFRRGKIKPPASAKGYKAPEHPRLLSLFLSPRI